MFNIPFINTPLGWVLEKLAIDNSFAWAVFLFTLLINIVLIPLSIKSQKSSVQQARIKPKLDELKKRYGDDKQKLSQATSKLYQDEGVSMAGGCLPMLIRLFLMLSIYALILSPLTYIAGAESKDISTITTTVNNVFTEIKTENEETYKAKLQELGWTETKDRAELSLVGIMRSDAKEAAFKEFLGDKFADIEEAYNRVKAQDTETAIDYSFVSKKIDLTETPKFNIDIFNKAQIIWVMPVLAFVMQILSSLLSAAISKKNNPDAPSMMGMMLTMPLLSLFIGFSLPGGVTFYWACSSIVSGLIQVAVQFFYGPQKMLARERAKELCVQCDFEAKQLKKLGDEQ